MKTKYYRCKFIAYGGSYSLIYFMDKYDLTTNNKKEIKETLKKDGWRVKEIYNIKIQ